MTPTPLVFRRMARRLTFALCLLVASAVAPAASITYNYAYHTDDVILEIPGTIAHDEANTFGHSTASLPGVGLSTSFLTGSDYALTFIATHSLTGVDLSMVHTLLSVRFTPSVDMPFTFSAGYDAPAGANYVGLGAGFIDVTDAITLTNFEFYGPVTTPPSFTIPAPTQSILLAGHIYGFVLEVASETSVSPNSGTPGVAYLTIHFGAVPLPTSVTAGAASLAILAARRAYMRRTPARN